MKASKSVERYTLGSEQNETRDDKFISNDFTQWLSQTKKKKKKKMTRSRQLSIIFNSEVKQTCVSRMLLCNENKLEQFEGSKKIKKEEKKLANRPSEIQSAK